RGAMGSQTVCDTYVKPLLEKGFVPMDVQAQLVNGLISKDREGMLKDVSHLAQLAIKEKEDAQEEAKAKGQPFDEKQFHAPATDELHKLLHDTSYQDKALSFLSDDRTVALAVLKNSDGKIHPEDTIRLKLNHWGGTDDIMSALKIKPPLTLDQLSRDY